MGLAVMMDKPILLLVEEGTVIPQNLHKMARTIKYYRRDHDADSLARATAEALGELGIKPNKKTTDGGIKNAWH